jgi:hypothetical protein
MIASFVCLPAAMLLMFLNSANADWGKQFQDWFVGESKGSQTHSVGHDRPNNIFIDCNFGADPIGGADISIQISNSPDSNSDVSFVFDGQETKVRTDGSGLITVRLTNDDGDRLDAPCPACSAEFRRIWYGLRTAKSLIVRFSDGRSAQFSLKGAAQAFEKEPCGGFGH